MMKKTFVLLLSMEEYLRRIQALADSLMTSGEPLKKYEIIDYVTGDFVTILFFQEPKTIDEIFSLLVTQELGTLILEVQHSENH